jgi:hypothetical protein
VMQSHRSLDQALVVEAKRPASRTPEIFPGFVSLEVASGVEKKYSVPEEVGHLCNPLSY